MELSSFVEEHLVKKGIFCFNTNIDVIIKDGGLKVEELGSLAKAITSGKEVERKITKMTSKIILEKFRGRRRIGGQAGNMANAAAKLGISCLVHCADLNEEVMKLFEDGVEVAGCYSQPSYHFIFELEGRRVIASHDPANFEMRICNIFKEESMRRAGEFDRAIISGFHNLKESLVEEKVGEIIDIIVKWKKRNNRMKIHLELGDFRRLKALREIMERLLQHVDSVGMNEREAMSVARVSSVRGDEFSAMASLADKVDEVVCHGKDLCFAISSRRGDEVLEKALIFASGMAAYKGVKGKDGTIRDVYGFIKKCKRKGVKREDALKFLKMKERVDKNGALIGSFDIRPEITVGLGDSFTVGYFFID